MYIIMSIIMFIIMYPLLCNARLRMANGEWRMANGEWRMVSCLRMVSGTATYARTHRGVGACFDAGSLAYFRHRIGIGGFF